MAQYLIRDGRGNRWVDGPDPAELTQTIGTTGTELAYSENVSGFTTSTAFSPTPPQVTGIEVSFTAGSRPVILEAGCHSAQNGTAGSGCVILVKDLGGTEYGRAWSSSGLAALPFELFIRRRISLAPGAYTMRLYAGTISGGSLTFNAGATFPIWLQVTEV